MSFPHEWLKQLESTALSQTILESGLLFPGIETLHVLALTLVFGTIAIVDLRLLGLLWRERTVASVAGQVLRWTWGGFAGALLTGSLLFISAPVKYFDNGPFRIKLALLLLAGLNMALFQWRHGRQLAHWPAADAVPLAARWAGGLSLLFWLGVLGAGRAIAFSGY